MGAHPIESPFLLGDLRQLRRRLRQQLECCGGLMSCFHFDSACFCGTTGSACDWLRGAEAVFVGRVIEDSGEGYGTGPARMIVEEVLHGLPATLHEVTVDTDAGTSCYMRLKKDERYVIYGSR